MIFPGCRYVTPERAWHENKFYEFIAWRILTMPQASLILQTLKRKPVGWL